MKYIGLNQWKSNEFFYDFCYSVKNNTYDKIIYFGQCEYEYYGDHNFKYINEELCKSKNQPLHVITAGVKWNTSWFNPKVAFVKTDNMVLHKWGTFWFTKTFVDLVRANTRGITDNDNFNYSHHFISMNNRLHMHRCLFIDLLAKNDLIKHGAISVHLTEIKKLGENKERITKYPWKYFTPVDLTLDTQYITKRDQWVLPIQYYNSFLQVVCETADNGIFLTEKTAIPLIVGKPFIVASEPEFYKFLTDLGFQLYDEIFDYSFDAIADRETRYSMMLENVIRISKLSKDELPKLYQKIKHKLEFNKAMAKKIILDETMIPDIVKEVFEHYEKTNEVVDPDLISTLTGLKEHKYFNY